MDRTKLGKQPIETENVAGKDIKYDPEFDELQSEIDKLTALTGGLPDWARVVRLSEEILSSKSKDLKVAVYLCAALLKTEGIKGLTQGLNVCRDLLANFWEQLFPPKKRLRGRIGSLTWLANYLEHDLADLEINEDQASDAKACKKAWEDLENIIQQLLADKAPNFKPVTRIMRLWPEPKDKPLEEAPPPEEKKPPEEPPAKPKAGAAPRPPKVSIDELTSAAEIQKALRDQLVVLRRLAGRLQEITPTSAVPYHLLFQSIWVTIETAPPSQEGKTLIPQPSGGLSDRLKGLEAKGAWPDLLKESMARVTELPLWLDLARYIWMAADNQGDGWRQVAQAVRQEAGILIERLPELKMLTFSDGTPLADDRTREWLESTSVGISGTPEGGQKPQARATPEKSMYETHKEQAEQMFRAGNLKKALEFLFLLSRQAPSGEESFRYRLAMAKLCMEADRHILAEPILAALSDETEHFRLEDWQPDLAAEATHQFYVCEKGLMGKKNPTPEQRQRIKELYERLCRLDPATAFDMGQ